MVLHLNCDRTATTTTPTPATRIQIVCILVTLVPSMLLNHFVKSPLLVNTCSHAIEKWIDSETETITQNHTKFIEQHHHTSYERRKKIMGEIRFVWIEHIKYKNSQAAQKTLKQQQNEEKKTTEKKRIRIRTSAKSSECGNENANKRRKIKSNWISEVSLSFAVCVWMCANF